MALSKPETIDAIMDLDSSLEREELETMTMKELDPMLLELQAGVEEDEGDEDGEGNEPEVEEVKKAPYTVAEGVCVSTMKGIIGSGEEITAKMIGDNGEANLKALVKAGKVDKNG